MRPSRSTVYHPLIDDPDHVARLEGHRYVVLRPTGAVPNVHDRIRALLKEKLTGLEVSYPAQGHVTLAGFANGALEAVRRLAADWAATVPALRLEVQRVSVFPTPFQVVILQIRRTAELFEALASLRRLADRREFGNVLTTPPAEWIFHMSIAYCSSLSAASWEDVVRYVDSLEAPAAQCVVNESEIVAFDNGQEYSGGIVELSGGRRA